MATCIERGEFCDLTCSNLACSQVAIYTQMRNKHGYLQNEECLAPKVLNLIVCALWHANKTWGATLDRAIARQGPTLCTAVTMPSKRAVSTPNSPGLQRHGRRGQDT